MAMELISGSVQTLCRGHDRGGSQCYFRKRFPGGLFHDQLVSQHHSRKLHRYERPGYGSVGQQFRRDFCRRAGHDIIGGAASGARNVISGNKNNAGVFVQYGSTTSITIQGNFIGTDVHRTRAVGNNSFGIWVNNGPIMYDDDWRRDSRYRQSNFG